MSAMLESFHQSVYDGQGLLNDVVGRFFELLVAGGASASMIENAMAKALASAVENKSEMRFTELGALLRDCMEVMCRWRRETNFVDGNGEPLRLEAGPGPRSFEALCSNANCKHDPRDIRRVLVDFGAVSISVDGKLVSETPTFLISRPDAGGRLATDGLLKHLEGYLRVVHGNVSSASGRNKPRFERACTVSVAIELEPVFDRLVRSRGQEFIDSIDEWLERNSKRESSANRYLELGAGAYFIDLGEHARRATRP